MDAPRKMESAPMKIVLAIVAAIVAALAFTSSASAASPVACKVGHLDEMFPGAGKIRAHNVPRLTYGYAPRCLVAESIVGNVQWYWRDHGRAPRSTHVY